MSTRMEACSMWMTRMLAVLLVVGPELGVTGTFEVPYH
jgi:hypothetical protein